ncbi:MAG: helix-turn-helix transcriptional regulator [Endomicrobium sp.]|jgi:DNA-binding HxlR family transcriptional regulator|nr:helix-turn-helix transcriptional regulator [Endomicrobium sp.]
MIPKRELLGCPVLTTVNLIGNKWKLLILRDLFNGTKRFGELRRSVHGISQKVLTQNLKELEKDGIIERKVHAEVPPRVEYKTNKLGQTIQPIIAAMWKWGETYQKKYKKN